MSEKAAEVGMGKIFHAAILALQRQDEDSKVGHPANFVLGLDEAK